jgi:hypothetical protein
LAQKLYRAVIFLCFSYLLCSLGCLYRVYGSSLAELAEALETKDAVCKSIQSVISADAYVKAGMDVCAALSVKDVAGFDKLAIRSLGAQTLGIGITAVLGGAHSLFMCEELKI